jgi:hypothetical protein
MCLGRERLPGVWHGENGSEDGGGGGIGQQGGVLALGPGTQLLHIFFSFFFLYSLPFIFLELTPSVKSLYLKKGETLTGIIP